MNKIFYLILFYALSTTTKPVVNDTILIIDFGSPITHCIASCVQQVQVHSQICWYTQAEKIMQEVQPKGIILSGSPNSVVEPQSPRAPECVFSSGIPVLGICYGQQLMCVQLGGSVMESAHPEKGETILYVTGTCALTQNLWPPNTVTTIWMGHEDCLVNLPKGFTTVAHTAGSHHAIIADDTRKFYGLQFHPEVQHIKEGQQIIHVFVRDVVKAKPDLTLVPPKYDLTMIADPLLYGCCSRHNFTKN